jgi:hypothetical protein
VLTNKRQSLLTPFQCRVRRALDSIGRHSDYLLPTTQVLASGFLGTNDNPSSSQLMHADCGENVRVIATGVVGLTGLDKEFRYSARSGLHVNILESWTRSRSEPLKGIV